LQYADVIIVFLHGYGGSISDVKWLAEPVLARRTSGISFHIIQAPFGWLGRYWFDNEQELIESRTRTLDALQAIKSKAPNARIVLSGFSQGAIMALDIGVQSPHVGAIVALSPCNRNQNWKERGQLRVEVPIWVVAGRKDSLCPFQGVTQIVEAFSTNKRQVAFYDFDGDHYIEDAGFKALGEAAQ
jgi:predicted esterase